MKENNMEIKDEDTLLRGTSIREMDEGQTIEWAGQKVLKVPCGWLFNDKTFIPDELQGILTYEQYYSL